MQLNQKGLYCLLSRKRELLFLSRNAQEKRAYAKMRNTYEQKIGKGKMFSRNIDNIFMADV